MHHKSRVLGSDSTWVVKVNRRKTNRRKTRPYCSHLFAISRTRLKIYQRI